MVLSAYGITKSEKYLAKLTKTSRTKGCWEKEIIKAAKMFGLCGYVKEKSSVRELRKLIRQGIPVIVDWFSPEEGGHYSVAVEVTQTHIFLADSHFGEIRKHRLDWFEERWFDLPFRRQGPLMREIIVIQKKDY